MNAKGSKSKSKASAAKTRAKQRATPARPAKSGARSPTLAGIQRKLDVGQKDDSFEREADAIADRVVNDQPSPTISQVPSTGLPCAAQREEKEPEKKKEDEKKPAQKMSLQRAEAAEEKTPAEEADKDEKATDADAAQAMPIQRAAKSVAEDEDKDRKKEPTQKKDDEKKPEEDKDKKAIAQKMPVQRKASTEEAETDAAEEAISNRGPGEPLHPSVQRRVEASTGADMRDVRVHRDEKAAQAAQKLNAKAFTHGKDIWLGRGQSPRDTRLMAHEAAHVVQQTGRAQGKAVQKTGVAPSPAASSGGAGTAAPKMPTSTPEGQITFSSGTAVARRISMPKISLPSLANKDTISGPFIAAPPGRTLSGQRDIWRSTIRQGGYDAAVDAKLPNNKGIPKPAGDENAPRIFFLKAKNQNSYIIGTPADIKESAKLPNWDPAGNRGQPLEVDHIKEAQLNGANTIDNFQLLDRPTNSAVGNAIRAEIKERIENAAKQYVGPEFPYPTAREVPSADALRAQCEEVKFEGKESKGMGGAAKSWDVAKIRAGEQIDALKMLTPAEVAAQKLMGDPTRLLLNISESAGKPKAIPWDNNGPKNLNPNMLGIKGFEVTAISYMPGSGGSLSGNVYKNNKIVEGCGVTDLPITEIGGLPYTARLDGTAIKSKVRSGLRAKGASPIEIDDAYFSDEALTTRGVIKPTITIFKQDLTIDIAVDGDDVTVSKTFTAGDFKFPGPIKVTESSLTISAGTAGLKVEGAVNFEVDRVGKGKISGEGSIAGGFAVQGDFDFDKELFNEADAHIKVRYAEEKFSGEGNIKIGDGKVKGIKSASAEVKVDGEKWEATGVVEPKIPGVSTGTLGVKFDPEKGLEITGRLEFSKDIPRLKSGHIEAKVTKTEAGYQVEGSGAAELDIPGVTAGLTAEYKDGIFRAQATLGYAKDFASGEITAGVTNQAIDESGQPSGEPGEVIRPYGKGRVSLQFTPWLKGTAGIKLDPSGKMEVTGRIEVPNKLEVFPQKAIEKKLLSLGVDIPIVGVSVAGQRVGIFLNISGSLTAKASIGPGTLENVAVEATFDPDDMSTAKITGTASFVVPAEAGLRLGISGAIGAGIPIVSAKAGLEIGGELGVKGEARADAKVEWSPQTGVNMEADLSVQAQPVFLLDITGFVDVSADLLIDEIQLYHKDWKLASFEFGSGMTLGAKLKVKVENSVFKVPSFEDIEFIKPDIDLMQVANNIIDQIK